MGCARGHALRLSYRSCHEYVTDVSHAFAKGRLITVVPVRRRSSDRCRLSHAHTLALWTLTLLTLPPAFVFNPTLYLGACSASANSCLVLFNGFCAKIHGACPVMAPRAVLHFLLLHSRPSESLVLVTFRAQICPQGTFPEVPLPISPHPLRPGGPPIFSLIFPRPTGETPHPPPHSSGLLSSTESEAGFPGPSAGGVVTEAQGGHCPRSISQAGMPRPLEVPCMQHPWWFPVSSVKPREALSGPPSGFWEGAVRVGWWRGRPSCHGSSQAPAQETPKFSKELIFQHQLGLLPATAPLGCHLCLDPLPLSLSPQTPEPLHTRKSSLHTHRAGGETAACAWPAWPESVRLDRQVGGQGPGCSGRT